MPTTCKQTQQVQTPTTQTGPVSCTPEERQPMGNQAALDALGQSSSFFGVGGFLEGLLGDAAGSSRAPSTSGTAPTLGSAKQDEDLGDLDLSTIPDVRVGSDQGVVSMGLNGVRMGVGGKEVTEDEFWGDSSTQSQAVGGFDGSTLSLGGQRDDTLADGAGKSSVGLVVDSNGKVVANAGGSVGDYGVAVGGMLDVDEDLNLQSAGASAKVDFEQVSAEVGAAVQFAVPERDGRTVSWNWGANATVGGEVKKVGGELGGGVEDAQSITFPTEADAVAYAQTAKSEGADDLAELSSVQVESLKPGVSLSYTQTQSGTVGASVFAGLSVDAERSRSVDIERGEGGKIRMKVSQNGRSGAKAGVDNGVLGATGSQHFTDHETWSYEVDLADPVQRAAFDAFQAGEEMDPVLRTDGEAMEGTESTLGATLPMINLAESETREDGVIYRDGEAFDAKRGSSGFDSNQHSRYDLVSGVADYMEFAAQFQIDPDFKGRLLEDAARLDSWAEHKKREQLEAVGTQSGSESHLMDALVPQGTAAKDAWDQTTLVQKQSFQFDDRRQAAAMLHDQVLAGTDLTELDPATLPASEASDRKYVLESEIDGEGSFELIEKLRQKQDLPLEWEAMRCVVEIREAFLHGGGNPAAFGKFVQDFAAEGGEDALEGLRSMVKDEHVTQYLMIEGDDVFIGQQGNKKVEDLFRATELLLQDGNDTVVMQAEQLIARETTRLEKLVSGNGYEEVPMSIRDAEATRCRTRIKRLGGAL